MSDIDLLEGSQVHAIPAVADAKPAVAMQMLDGDEIVQLSLKPSIWYIPLVSLNVVLPAVIAALGATAIAANWGWTPLTQYTAQLALLAAVVRVAIASLQWASRLYVLTNRRIMSFRGVLTVEASECQLSRISRVDLNARWYEKLLRVGTAELSSVGPQTEVLYWQHLARPDEIHGILVKAVRRAQMHR